MKISIVASALLAGVLMLSGCGESNSGGTCCKAKAKDVNNDKNDDGNLEVKGDTSVSDIDPTVGGTVNLRTNSAGGNDVAAVVKAELNECGGDITTLGTRVACGPKEGTTYVFQSDFGLLGPVDDNASTPDGGVLLYDALTVHNGTEYPTPNLGNQAENRIQEVYIPANYIVLDDQAKNDPISKQYEYMAESLSNMMNMQCLASEPTNNPYFTTTKTSGEFVATYVMHFTRGIGEINFDTAYAGSGKKDNLEYLTVSFPLKIEQKDGNSSKLQFTSNPGPVTIGIKQHGQDAIVIDGSHANPNTVLHQTTGNIDDALSMNMAAYFDKLMNKIWEEENAPTGGTDINGGGDYTDILQHMFVENFTNPWPVKIYGTLHEVKQSPTEGHTSVNTDDANRSYVRNPATIDSSLFDIDKVGEYKDLLKYDPQAIKFNIVYPGGKYNKL